MIRFGDVEVDGPGREVLRRGQPVHLEPQAFDLLVALLEHRDRVLTKNELFDGVWGHRFVSDANLTTRIREIRRAVGDDGAHQHTIRNVRGRGYRFVAEVEVLAPATRERAGAGLIGRDDELAELLPALEGSPLVTLTGPGGVGKSTIARAVAERAAMSYADGVRVVELSTLDGGDQVLPALARALDVVLDADRPERAIRSIAELDVLVVLDNCEHVIDAVGDVVGRLMSITGAKVGVLATSQVRLGLSEERVFNVQPLSSERAMELFAVRASAVRPGFDLADVGRGRVATLLGGLDQLPLTIEMAAARLGSMTFDELEGAISEGTPIPVTHRSPVLRHRSLESMVNWSAALLDTSLRQTFTEFAVFAGSVTAADAVAVVGGGRHGVIFDLAALAERSLLVAGVDGSATRYRMLATVRGVASRWLEESSTADEVRGRHAAHFSEAMWTIDRQIRTADEADGRRRLDDIAAEVRAAHRWARRHQPQLAAELSAALHLAAYSTFWNEPAEWSRLLLAQRPDDDRDSLAGARIVVAGADANRGLLADARATASALMTAADKRVRATAWEILADVAIYDGRLSEVAAIADELHRLGVELDDPHSVAIAAVDASLALAFDNQGAGALTLVDGLDLDRMSQSDRGWVLYAKGEALAAAGDSGAAAAYAEAIEIARGVGNSFVASVARESLATELARSGRFPESLEAYAVCLHEYARHGNFVHAVTTVRNVVELLVAVGDDRGATVLMAATSRDQVRPSYGQDAVRLSRFMADVAQRVGPSQFATWTEEGRLLDLPQAVQVAVELVDRQRV